jgi:hypothetical protein
MGGPVCGASDANRAEMSDFLQHDLQGTRFTLLDCALLRCDIDMLAKLVPILLSFRIQTSPQKSKSVVPKGAAPDGVRWQVTTDIPISATDPQPACPDAWCFPSDWVALIFCRASPCSFSSGPQCHIHIYI